MPFHRPYNKQTPSDQDLDAAVLCEYYTSSESRSLKASSRIQGAISQGGIRLSQARLEGSQTIALSDYHGKKPLPRGVTSRRLEIGLGMLVAALLTLPAVLPLAQPGLPVTDDGLFHVGRLVELREAIATGDLFPRWAEPFVEGLGFPFFNFYAPLSYYLALSLTLFGLAEADAFKLTSALVPLFAAATMYLWVIATMGSAGLKGRLQYVPALGAAVAYTYAPYQLVEIYRRGALAESLALALLPLLLYAADRLRQQPGLSSVLFLSLTLSALVLAHNAMALMGIGLACSYVLFLALAGRLSSGDPHPPTPSPRPEGTRGEKGRETGGAPSPIAMGEGRVRVPRGGVTSPVRLAKVIFGAGPNRLSLLYFALAVVLGLGISALFWMPAMLERGYLNFEQLSTGWFSAQNHLIYSWPPFQTSPSFDFQNPFRVGLVQALFLMLGVAVVAAVRGSLLKRGLGHDEPGGADLPSALVTLSTFFICVVAVVFFLLSPASAWVWSEAPLLSSMQFPWRTLGLLTLSGGFLAAVGLLWLGLRWPRLLLPVAATALAGFATASLMSLPANPFQEGPVPYPDSGVIHSATSIAGWGLRSARPTENTSRFDAGALVELRAMERRPGRIALKLEAARAMSVALHALYFPGWEVLVDGRETPSFPVSGRGLLGFSVPEGSHTVEARFERTPLQTTAEAISLLSALAVVTLLGLSVVRRRPASGAIAVAILLAGFFVLPRVAARQSPASEFRPAALPPSGGIRLLGIGEEQSSDGRLGLTLYWQALEQLDELEGFVALVDEQGYAVGRSSRQPLEGAYPTSSWQIGEIVPDKVWLDYPSGSRTTSLRLSAGFRSPGLIEDTVVKASFHISLGGERLAPPPSNEGPPRAELVLYPSGEGLVLESYGPVQPVVQPGDSLPVDMRWRATATVPHGIGAYLHLVAADGKMWAQDDRPLGPTDYPSVLWPVGERVREERLLAIPANIPPDRYALRLGGYRYPGLQSLPILSAGRTAGETPWTADAVLGDVFVVAAHTRPAAIQPQRTARITFGDQIELLGFDLPEGELQPGREFNLTTYWRATRPVPDSYTVFAHIVDPSGALRAQKDGEPAGGSYPTFLWRPGELIVDSRTIRLDSTSPEGNYLLVVGLYRWPSLDRLQAVQEGIPAASAVELGTVRVTTAKP